MRILFVLILAANLFAQSQLEYKDAWIRSGAEGMNTAFFVKIHNSSDQPDYLLKAEASFATVVEVHETYKKDGDMMGMREVEQIEVPANATLLLKPMSYHVMLIKLKEDMTVGKKGKVKLFFKNAGMVEVEAEVKDMNKKMKKNKMNKDMKHGMKSSSKADKSCCGE